MEMINIARAQVTLPRGLVQPEVTQAGLEKQVLPSPLALLHLQRGTCMTAQRNKVERWGRTAQQQLGFSPVLSLFA